MRQISLPQVGVFMALFILVLLLAAATSYWGLGSLPLGDFRGVVLLLGGVVAMYVWAFVAYRLFLKRCRSPRANWSRGRGRNSPPR